MITLKSKIRVVKVNKKSSSPAFKGLKIGDVIEMSIPVKAVGGDRGSTHAAYIKCLNTRTQQESHLSFNQIEKTLECVEYEELPCGWYNPKPVNQDRDLEMGGVNWRSFLYGESELECEDKYDKALLLTVCGKNGIDTGDIDMAEPYWYVKNRYLQTTKYSCEEESICDVWMVKNFVAEHVVRGESRNE